MNSVIKNMFDDNSLLTRWRLQISRKNTIPYDEDNLEPGDVVSVSPAFGIIPFMYHYGVYVGDKNIVHVQKDGIVKYDMDKFLSGRTKVYIEKLEPFPHELDNEELFDQRRRLIVDTADSMVGHDWEYKALSENCESFTNWVTTGKMHSQQGIVMRNTAFLYGASVIGYFLGRGRVRFWRPNWWRRR